MKRIAIVSNGLSGGGAERVASILANCFSRQGDSVLFIAAYEQEKEYPLDHNVKYLYTGVRDKNKLVKMLHRAWKIDNAISAFNCDIVISFIINETIILNLKHKVPIIYSLRIAPGNVKEKRLNWLMCQLMYRRAENIVFQTKDAKDFFCDGIRRKGSIIGNPLVKDLPYWNIENHKKTIITACRLCKQKNIKMLIEGFAEFHKMHPEYRLKIYGNGPLKKELMEFASDLKVGDCVEFPGHSKNIHRIMSESAIFALTSDFEGLSNSMLEALAIGLPTVCTDCPPGGAKEYINDWKNGMLVPVGDAGELQKRFCALAESEQLCRDISENAVKIRKKLDEDSVMEKWNEIISNILSREYRG